MVRDFLLVMSAATWMLLIRALKYAVPLPRLVRATCSRASTRTANARDTARVVAVVDRVAAALETGNGGACLERSLTLARMLARLGQHSQLVVGVRRGKACIDGHTWVTIDGVPVGENVDQFTPVTTFDIGTR